jgi:hypothetical protein
MKHLFLILGLNFNLLIAHEGAHGPAANPLPKHGGKVTELTHKGAHAHGANADELFFEISHSSGKLLFYPLVRRAGKDQVEDLPTSEVSGIQADVEYNRPPKSKEKNLNFSGGQDGSGSGVFETALKIPREAKRILSVKVAANHQNEKKEGVVKDIALK